MVNEFNLNPYELKEDYVFSASGLSQGQLPITIPNYSLLRSIFVFPTNGSLTDSDSLSHNPAV